MSATKQTGVVKWFNANKGYGFICREDGDDLFVHHTQIVMEGYRKLEQGARVEFDAVPGSKGYEAKSVVLVG